MTLEERRAYTETLIVLEELDLINEIPIELVKLMRNSREDSWKFSFDKNISIENQKIMRKTVVLLSTIYIAYICNDEGEKQKLKKLYMENEKKAIECYGSANVIDINKSADIQVVNSDNEKLPVVTKKTFIKEVFQKIKNFFHI